MFELLFKYPRWAFEAGRITLASGWQLGWLIALLVVGAALIGLTLARYRTLGLARLTTIGLLQLALLAVVAVALWQPTLVVDRARDRQNALALVIDSSASMAEQDDKNTRVQEAVTSLKAGPLDTLKKTFDVRLAAFASELTPLDTLDKIPATGSQTRIGDALLRTLQGASGVPLAAVVLVSDGEENGDSLSEERLREIASYGVPIHTVGIGPEQTHRDLEVTEVRAPTTASQGAKAEAQVTIAQSDAQTARLRVYADDELVATRTLAFNAQQPKLTTSVEIPVGDPGLHELKFTVDGLDGERNVINNTATSLLDVSTDKRAVLIVEGELGWEFKFIHRALESERSLRLASLVRTTPNKFYRQGLANPDELAQGFPAKAEDLFRYDAVVIGNFDAPSLSAEQQQLLKDFVDRRGGSLLILAGRKSLADGGWGNTVVGDTLPTHLMGGEQSTFQVGDAKASLTPYGAETSALAFDADPKRNAELWQTLPPLADYQTLGRLKPGAVVLLEAALERGRAPLLVWQRFGRGATYELGTQSTMRWQLRTEPEDMRHEAFWRQLMHALADHADRRLSLRAERSVYNDERTIKLEAQVMNERFEPVNDATVEIRAADERGNISTLTMTPVAHEDGHYTAAFDAPATGLYRFDMNAKRNGTSIGSSAVQVRRNDGVLEHFHTEQNRPMLERIASLTGGRYWTLNDLNGLAAAVPYTKAGIIERQALPLWNAPAIFLLILLIKSTEWLLRWKWGTL